MKSIAIIPARYASTRFPGKPLTMINGKSMIMRVYEQAQLVKGFSKVIVATDDERIFDHVHAAGGEVVMTSSAHQSGTDRCGEVIETLNENFDVVVNVQGDEPFIQPAQLELVLSAFDNPDTQIATLVKKINDPTHVENRNIVKVAFSDTHVAELFSRNPISYNGVITDPVYYKHIGIYAYRSEILKEIIRLKQTESEKKESLEQLRWLENGYRITVMETDMETIAVDTPDDLKKLES